MPEHSLPTVSVIMPIRNEEAFIERSVGAVLAQDYPADLMEIVVADGMSNDRTRAIIAAMPGAERVRVIDNPGRIQAAGLNAAINEARGAIIVRVDGHTIIAADYVSACVRALTETGAGNVGGAMDPVGTTWIGKAIAAAGKSAFAVPSAFHVSDKAQSTDTVYLGAWPREVFDKVGVYNTGVGVNEDYELNVRIRDAGYTIYFTPEIRSTYYGRQTLRALARQYARYGRSKLKTLREHPRSLRMRQIVAPGFVLVLIGGGIGAIFAPWIRLLWLAMIALYVAAALIASLATAARRGWATLPALPLVFFIIHVAWGLGFWAELIAPSSLQPSPAGDASP